MAPARQDILAGQSPQSVLAYSTSSGDSAKNSSGSSRHGSSLLPLAIGSSAGAAGTRWLAATCCTAAPAVPNCRGAGTDPP